MKNPKFLLINLITVTICIFMSAHAQTVENVFITALGTWVSDDVNGNQTAYVTLDQEVGPSECRNRTLKIDFKNGGDSGKFTKSLLLTAFSYQLPVTIELSDECLYGNPTFKTIRIRR